MMRKYLLLTFSLLVFGLVQATNPLQTDKERTTLELVSSKSNSIEFINEIGDFSAINVKTSEGTFTKIRIPGYHTSGEHGMPGLPEISRLVEIPYGAKARIEIISWDEETVYLEENGFHYPLMPAQPSVNKSEDPDNIDFVYKRDFYESGSLYSPETVSVEASGRVRGVQMARIAIRPFEYNSDDNSIIIRNNLHVKIHFEKGDESASRSNKARFYSPAFEPVYNKLWNFEAPSTKDALSEYPIKYVIVADRMFETALQPFIEWKTQKGFHVVEAYTDQAEVGNTTSSIKTYLEGLYNAGTAEDPAPTYVLFVGDTGQVPTFDGSAGSHVSDMYYCEYDGGGDYIPEVYFGRFSATSVAELSPQINKTLQFEQYTMPDPSYLGDVVMVAGVDGTFGDSHGNGQVNYGTNEYFNLAHGMESHTYNYPESGDNAANILSDISAGAGYVNYTAHCSSNGWADPSFSISDIAGLDNQDKYYVSVGNCCLSNKFDDAETYGEALLRAQNEGAVAHLGGSNSTYWDEDFYWSVGLISDPYNDPSYAETETGAYDALFHENDEEPYVTTAQMNYVGNLAVESSSSDLKDYYWEIYHVMGDPSLMPYLGVPTELTVDYLDPQPMGTGSLTVNTEAGAYVAISNNGVLLDAKLADASGVAELSFDAINEVVTCDVVVTKQNRQPYIGTVDIIPNDNDYDVQLSQINLPEDLIFVDDATFQPEVEITNLGQVHLTSASVNYQIDGGDVTSEAWSGSLDVFENDVVSFPEITLAEGTYTFKAWACEPNGEVDEYPQNDTLEKEFRIYGGNVTLVSIDMPEAMNCNVTEFTPEISIKNNDSNPLTQLTVGYSCGFAGEEFEWTGNLAAGETTTITFTESSFPIGLNTMTAWIEAPNGGTDMDVTDNSLDKDVRVTIGQSVEIDLLTDNYPEETSWELVEDETGDVLYENGSLNSEQHHYTEMCLGGGCYTFTIYDSYGDGLAGGWYSDPGSVVITNMETSEEYGSIEGDFGDDASISFCLDLPGLTATPDNLVFDDLLEDETAELSYHLSGSNLSDDVTVTAPEGFTISTTSGSDFSSNLVLPAEDGTVDETVYVQFAPESIESYSGQIMHETADVPNTFVSVSGNCVVSIDEETLQSVSVYPNPSKGTVYVSAEALLGVEVIDALGRTVMKRNSTENEMTLELDQFSGNVFMIKIITESGTDIRKIKIIK
ncbi:MAG: C25 family cysteine peptidase [Bacteroidota bacterium]